MPEKRSEINDFLTKMGSKKGPRNDAETQIRRCNSVCAFLYAFDADLGRKMGPKCTQKGVQKGPQN